MAASTKEFLSILNGLIETCKNGEEGFRQAAEGTKNEEYRQMYLDYSQQRAKFAQELQQIVSRLGGTPETSGSVAAAAHRGWINLKAAVTGNDEHAILAECERGEDVAVDDYQKALREDLPSDLRSTVENQFRQIQQAHNRIRSLRNLTDHK
jgi:uncharacterized protein (TIGR02284 family)